MKNFWLLFLLLNCTLSNAQENTTIKYGTLLEFKVPKKYELRTNAYINEVKKEILKDLEFNGEASQYVLQPKGLNDANGVSKLYSRILIKIQYGNFVPNKNINQYSKLDLDNMRNSFISEMGKIKSIKIINTKPVTKLFLKGKTFIDLTYTHVQDKDGAISNKILTYMDKTFIIRFTISYKESEEKYWLSSIQEFLDSITIKN
jgi:hypothetical protein